MSEGFFAILYFGAGWMAAMLPAWLGYDKLKDR